MKAETFNVDAYEKALAHRDTLLAYQAKSGANQVQDQSKTTWQDVEDDIWASDKDREAQLEALQAQKDREELENRTYTLEFSQAFKERYKENPDLKGKAAKVYSYLK